MIVISKYLHYSILEHKFRVKFKRNVKDLSFMNYWPYFPCMACFLLTKIVDSMVITVDLTYGQFNS